MVAPNGDYFARLNMDGSQDSSFRTMPSGILVVYTIIVQADGKVLIGGWFTSVNEASRGGIARLNPDGSLDTDFLNGLSGVNGQVNSMALQADGKVLIGGSFVSVNGVNRKSLARLNADGNLDTNFLNGLSGIEHLGDPPIVKSIAIQADGKILVGGKFTSVNGTSRNRIARLNSGGSLDTGFLNGLSGANWDINAVTVQADGKVLMAGIFTTVNDVSRNKLARLNADGNLDINFPKDQSGVGGIVYSVATQSDGKVLIGGQFSSVSGSDRRGVARLNADGRLDTTFLNGWNGVNGLVNSVASQADGKVLIGGQFDTVNGIARRNFARLNGDGSLDAEFLNGLSGANGNVWSIAVRPDGKVLIGGEFNSVNGIDRRGIAWLSIDGSIDTGYFAGLTVDMGGVRAVVAQADGKTLMGGWFTSVNGVSRGYVARLNTEGKLDLGFMNGLSGANGYVNSLAVQPDEKVLMGGDFTSVNGVPRSHVARLHADGSLDMSFVAAAIGTFPLVLCLAVQADGKVLIGGDFDRINPVNRRGIARLNTDGSMDTTFLNGLSGADGSVCALAPQADGKVLIGGRFSSVNGKAASFVARIYGLITEWPPSLSIQRSGEQVTLGWPSEYAGYTVQICDTLLPPNWMPLAAQIDMVGNQFQTTLPMASQAHFFRLYKP